MERPTTATWSQRAASAWNWASAVPDQSSHRVGTMSSRDVPWPGRRGSSTAYPAAARASARGRIDWGFPVNPWRTRTPSGPPAAEKGSAPCMIGAVTGAMLPAPGTGPRPGDAR